MNTKFGINTSLPTIGTPPPAPAVPVGRPLAPARTLPGSGLQALQRQPAQAVAQANSARMQPRIALSQLDQMRASSQANTALTASPREEPAAAATDAQAPQGLSKEDIVDSMLDMALKMAQERQAEVNESIQKLFEKDEDEDDVEPDD